MSRAQVTLLTAVLAAGLSFQSCGDQPRSEAELRREGRTLFEGTCAACHGFDLKGTEDGPSLLDPIYAPDHHPDEAFYRAVEEGVVPHHWNFGPMPPQIATDEEEVEAIIAYVRSRQREAGTFDRSPEP